MIGAGISWCGWMLAAKAILSKRCLSTAGRFTSLISTRPLKISLMFSACWKVVMSIGLVYIGSVGGGNRDGPKTGWCTTGAPDRSTP
jgi:hypothetical protein